MAAESRFANLSCFVSIFLTNWLDFTKTIIPVALMASESIAHSAFSLMSYWLRAHSGLRNNCWLGTHGTRYKLSCRNYYIVFFLCSQCFLYKSFQTRPTNRSEQNGLQILLVTVNLPDRFRFLGNCPPTPSLSYHKHLQLTTTENAITYHNALCWSLSKILHKPWF